MVTIYTYGKHMPSFGKKNTIPLRRFRLPA
jgi:hypothetical protein